MSEKSEVLKAALKAKLKEHVPQSVLEINKLVATAGARQRATHAEQLHFDELARRSMDNDGTPLEFIKKARLLLNAAADMGEAADDLDDGKPAAEAQTAPLPDAVVVECDQDAAVQTRAAVSDHNAGGAAVRPALQVSGDQHGAAPRPPSHPPTSDSLDAIERTAELWHIDPLESPNWDALCKKWAVKIPDEPKSPAGVAGDEVYGFRGIGIKAGDKPAAADIVDCFSAKLLRLWFDAGASQGDTTFFELLDVEECTDFLDAFRVCALAYDPARWPGVKSLYRPIWKRWREKVSGFSKLAPEDLSWRDVAAAERQIREHAGTLATAFIGAPRPNAACPFATASADATWVRKVGEDSPPPKKIVLAAGINPMQVFHIAVVEQPSASDGEVVERYISLNLARRGAATAWEVKVSATHEDACDDKPVWAMYVVAPLSLVDAEAVRSTPWGKVSGVGSRCPSPVHEEVRVLEAQLDSLQLRIAAQDKVLKSFGVCPEELRQVPQQEGLLAPKVIATRSGVEESAPDPKEDNEEALTMTILKTIKSGDVAGVMQMVKSLRFPHAGHPILTRFRVVDLFAEPLVAREEVKEKLLCAMSSTNCQFVTIGDIAMAMGLGDIASRFITELVRHEPSRAARKRVMYRMAKAMARAGTWSLMQRLMGCSHHDEKKSTYTGATHYDLDCMEQPRTLAVAILDHLAELVDPAQTSPCHCAPINARLDAVTQIWRDGFMPFLARWGERYNLKHIRQLTHGVHRTDGDCVFFTREAKQRLENLNMGSALFEVVTCCVAGGLVGDAKLQVVGDILFRPSTLACVDPDQRPLALMAKAASWDRGFQHDNLPEEPLWTRIASTLLAVLSMTQGLRSRRRAAVVSCLLTGPCLYSSDEPLRIVSGPDEFFITVIYSKELVRYMEAFLADSESASKLGERPQLEKLKVQWVSFKEHAEALRDDWVAAETARAAVAAEALLEEERGEADRLKREEAERRREKKQEQQARALRIQENTDAAIAAAGVRRREEMDQQREAFLSEWKGHLCSFIDQSPVNVGAYAEADTDKKRDVARKRLLTRPEAFLALGEEQQTTLRIQFTEQVDELLSLHEAHKLHIKWVNQVRRDAKRGSKQPAPPPQEKEAPGGEMPPAAVPDAEKKKRKNKNKGKRKAAPAASEPAEEPGCLEEPDGVHTLADVPGLTKPAAPDSTVGGTTTCIVCMAGERSHLFGPCGHIACCEACAPTFVCKPCPLCRTKVEAAIRMHHA